jgi:hypothetical protein
MLATGSSSHGSNWCHYCGYHSVHLHVIQDMQEGDMLCGNCKPHTQQIQRQAWACSVNYEGWHVTM